MPGIIVTPLAANHATPDVLVDDLMHQGKHPDAVEHIPHRIGES
jgi:hypothetical protein